MKVFLIILLSTWVFTVSPMAVAAGSATSEMATIIIELNHYPTAEDKKVLTHIINNAQATAGEKVIAAALIRMQHRVTDEDVDKLRRLAADDAVAKAESELARILLTIVHHPTRADIRRLKAVTD